MFERREHCEEWVDQFRRRFPPDGAKMHGWGGRATSIVVDGYGASIMLAPRLRGKRVHGLPQGVPTCAYPVAPYEGCPRGWRRTRDAFFVPIPLGRDGLGPGMWYDWTMNDGHTHHVAIVPSTTGLNPIVGRKADRLRLEQYKDRCPVHDIPFEGDRFCPVTDGEQPCGYRHPPQNYVASPNELWWDGFRRADGTVEQFFFSNDVLRHDVGVAVLGADRVPAFGFAFFRSKEAKPKPASACRRVASALPPDLVFGAPIAMGAPVCSGFAGGLTPPDKSTLEWPDLPEAAAGAGPVEIDSFEALNGDPGDVAVAACALVDSAEAPLEELPALGAMGASCDPDPQDDREVGSGPPIGASVGEIRVAAVERAVAVGRGAKINQRLEPDPRQLNEWQDEPAAVVTVYFVPEAVAVAILEGPKRDVVGDPAGYLSHVGVPAHTE